MTTTRRRRPTILAHSIGVVLAITTLSRFAKSDDIWVGNGANGKWSTGANWSTGAVPTFANPLQFGGALQLSSNNDATGTVVGIAFNAGAGAFTLSGNAITLASGITNSSANAQAVSLGGITLGAAQTFDAGSTAGGSLSVSSNITLGANTLTIAGSNNAVVSGILSGGGGLTKNGTGTLSLGGLNTYSGTTTINAGTLQSAVPNAFSPNSDFTVTGTGILTLAGVNSTVGALNDGGANTGVINNNVAGSLNAVLTIGNTGNSGSFSGSIQNGAVATLGINKVGAGRQVLSGNNTYTGPTTVTAGTLQAGSVAAFGVKSAVIVGGGGILDLGGNSVSIGSLSDVSGVGGTVQSTIGAATLTTGTDNTSTSYAGLIADGVGPLSLVKTGTGTQSIANTNTYSGDTYLNAGGLFANDPATATAQALGTGTLHIAGGTTLGSTVNGELIPNAIQVTGDFTIAAPVDNVNQSATHLTLGGNIDLQGATRTITGTTTGGQINFNGIISNGGLNLVSTATSSYTAFIFGNNGNDVANTYTGLTTVGKGAFLVLQKVLPGGAIDGAVQGDVLVNAGGSVDYIGPSDQIANTSTITVHGTGLTASGTLFAALELRNQSDTIGALNGDGTVGLGSGILTVSSGYLSGPIMDGNFGSGGNLTVGSGSNPAGTLNLTGANTYTGTTTVNLGTLNVTGSLASATININAGSFIAGSSTALGNTAAVTVAAGGAFEYHAATDAPLTIGSLTLNSGSGTTIGGSIGSTTTSAQTIVTGDVMPTAGTIKVDVFGIPGVTTGTPGTYTLLTAGVNSTLTTGATYVLGNVYDATNFSVSAVNATATTITATITPVAPLASAYWVGGVSGSPGVWAASNGTTSNWASDSTGTPTPLIPGGGAAVFFSASGATDPGNMTLGANMVIGSLTINNPAAAETRAVTLNDVGGNTLTVATSGGITINAGAGPVTLNPEIILGASQTWTNNSGNLFTVGGAVSNGASALTIAGTGNTTISGVIGSGPGGLIMNSPGTLTLSNTNTYTGDTYLNTGSIFANDPAASTGNSQALGTGTLHIANGTTLGSTVNLEVIPNPVQVNGNFTIVAPVDTVNPTPTATNIALRGNIDLQGSTRTITGTTPSGQISFMGAISNGGVSLASTAPSSFTAFIYGKGDGTDVANTYTGLTTVNSGAFLVLDKVLPNGGLDGAIAGDVLVNAGGSVDYIGPSDQIANTSNVTVHGSGLNSGGMQFAALELRNHSDTIGSLNGDGTVGLGSGVLAVGAGNFSGTIMDGAFGTGGQLVKYNIGTLTLSGANTFTGNTNINNGTLVLNGSVQSPTVLVNFAGVLMGTGTAFHDVRNAGVLAAGNLTNSTTGAFHIGGNYTQTGAGTLVVEIAGAQASQHDLVAVGGQATLDGTLRLVQLGSNRLKVGDKVQILTAGGGVSGTFANVQNGLATGTIITPTVVYHAKEVTVEAQQGSFLEFAIRSLLTPNQLVIASALDREVKRNGVQKLVAFLDGESLNNLPHDFNQIAPVEVQSIYTTGVSLANVQTGNLLRRMDDIQAGTEGFSASGLSVSGLQSQAGGSFLAPAPGNGGPIGADGQASDGNAQPEAAREIKAPDDRRRGFFFTGTGEFTHIGTTNNASGYSLETGGFTLGVDYRLNDHFAVGIDAGYAHTTGKLTGDGSLAVDGARLGAYATYFNEGFYADASVQGGYNNYDIRRSALQGTAAGNTTGGEVNALIATGYDFIGESGLRIGPTASFQYTHVGFGSFRESGSLAPLDYASQSAYSSRTAIGLRAAYDWHLNGLLLRPEIRAAWQHEFGDSAYAVNSQLVDGRSGNFTVQGAEIGRDSMLLGLGLSVLWNERTSTYIYYDGELGRSASTSNNISGGMRMDF